MACAEGYLWANIRNKTLHLARSPSAARAERGDMASDARASSKARRRHGERERGDLRPTLILWDLLMPHANSVAPLRSALAALHDLGGTEHIGLAISVV